MRLASSKQANYVVTGFQKTNKIVATQKRLLLGEMVSPGKSCKAVNHARAGISVAK